MFMRNSIKLLGSFWWGQAPCKCLCIYKDSPKRSYPERDTSTQNPPLLDVCCLVCVTLAGSSLLVWSMASSSSSLRRFPFFLSFPFIPFFKRYRWPRNQRLLYRVITAAEMDAITFNMYTVVLFYLLFRLFFFIFVASCLWARDLKWSLWPVCHFIAHRFVCVFFS